MGHMVLGVGSNDVGAVLKQVINISNVFTRGPRWLTLSSYTVAANGAEKGVVMVTSLVLIFWGAQSYLCNGQS